MFFCMFTLCSACVSALVIVLSDSLCERIRKWETCLILKEDIIGACLTRASVTETAALSGVSRSVVLKVVSTYRNHENTTSGKRNRGRKSALKERDRHTFRWIVSKNHRTTAA
jgi:hypothetical protein